MKPRTQDDGFIPVGNTIDIMGQLAKHIIGNLFGFPHLGYHHMSAAFGSCLVGFEFIHSGFGLGVERMVAWVCGLDHIRETIAFPRMLGRLRP